MPSRDLFFAPLDSLPAAIAPLTGLRRPDGVTCRHSGVLPWAATFATTAVAPAPLSL